jgi:hypothetical protein
MVGFLNPSLAPVKNYQDEDVGVLRPLKRKTKYKYELKQKTGWLR